MASSSKGSTTAQAMQAGTAVPADQHGQGGFPPFDPATFAPQLVWLVISFAFNLYRRQRGFTHLQELVNIFKTAFLFLISALAVAFLALTLIWSLAGGAVFLLSARPAPSLP